MSPTRREEQPETELLNRPEVTEVIIEQPDLLNDPRFRQRRLVEDLGRLHRSLLGPEQLLDRTNYSRPFPPPRRDGRHYPDGDRRHEDPFGRR